MRVNPNETTSSSSGTDSESPSSSFNARAGLSDGASIGIGVGLGLFGATVLILASIFYWKSRRREPAAKDHSDRSQQNVFVEMPTTESITGVPFSQDSQARTHELPGINQRSELDTAIRPDNKGPSGEIM